MRDIKFRVWDRETRVMHYPEYSTEEGYRYRGLHITINIYTGELKQCISNYDMNNIASDYIECDYIPMQYTGLKDKNGVEIYEGDICNTPEGIDCVKWLGSGLWFENNTYDFSWKEVNVIGNVYQNPELLEVK